MIYSKCFPWVISGHDADPAQPLKTAGEELDDQYHQLSDLKEEDSENIISGRENKQHSSPPAILGDMTIRWWPQKAKQERD